MEKVRLDQTQSPVRRIPDQSIVSNGSNPKVTEALKIVDKTWGREIWFANNDRYCGKILEIESGQRFSMHYHMLKDETWYVLSGSLSFTWIDTDCGKAYAQQINEGQCVRIEPGQPHQLQAIENRAVLCEVSTHHDDSDSYRIYR